MRKGFTMIELLIVVSIIGILAVALVPGLTSAPAKARDAARQAAVGKIITVIEAYNLDEGKYPTGHKCINDIDFILGGTVKLSEYLTELPTASNTTNNTTCKAGTDSAVSYQQLNGGGYVVYIDAETKKGEFDWELLELLDEGEATDNRAFARLQVIAGTETDYAFATIR